MGCISFNGNKIITSGGGGVIITNSKELAKKSFHLSTQASVDKLNYEHDDIGFNYRLTNLQASVGLATRKIKTFLGIKKKIKNFYSSRFKNLKILLLIINLLTRIIIAGCYRLIAKST